MKRLRDRWCIAASGPQTATSSKKRKTSSSSSANHVGNRWGIAQPAQQTQQPQRRRKPASSSKQQPAANPAVQSLDEDAEGDTVGLADESEVSHVARHGNKDHCARCRRQGPSIIFWLMELQNNFWRKFRSSQTFETDGKAEVGKVGERVKRKKVQVHEKVGKPRNTLFFQWFVAPEGQKVGSLTPGAEPCSQMRDEKLHIVVAWSTFPSQNVQSTPLFLKSACFCGAKHIWNSKCTKHLSVGASLEVEMLKKCMALWHKAHFKVKSVEKLTASEHFWTFRCRFAWQALGMMHLVKSEQRVL